MIDVVMPQMGESIVEGTLTKWLKKAGEHVERDEPLFEISTDKVDTEIPSPAAGTSRRDSGAGRHDGRHQHRGRTHQRWRRCSAPAAAAAPAALLPLRACACGSTRCMRRRSAAPAACGTPARSGHRRTRSQATPPTKPPGRLSPLVRKMARENNIDLNQVQGTGAGGRITKQDLETYLDARGDAPRQPPPPPLPLRLRRLRPRTIAPHSAPQQRSFRSRLLRLNRLAGSRSVRSRDVPPPPARSSRPRSSAAKRQPHASSP